MLDESLLDSASFGAVIKESCEGVIVDFRTGKKESASLGEVGYFAKGHT